LAACLFQLLVTFRPELGIGTMMQPVKAKAKPVNATVQKIPLIFMSLPASFSARRHPGHDQHAPHHRKDDVAFG